MEMPGDLTQAASTLVWADQAFSSSAVLIDLDIPDVERARVRRHSKKGYNLEFMLRNDPEVL